MHLTVDAAAGEITPHGGAERQRHAVEIATLGRIAWRKGHAYGKRSQAETTIFRLKRGGADRLTARPFGAKHREVAFRI